MSQLVIAKDGGNHERSAGVSPAVAQASWPRYENSLSAKE